MMWSRRITQFARVTILTIHLERNALGVAVFCHLITSRSRELSPVYYFLLGAMKNYARYNRKILKRTWWHESSSNCYYPGRTSYLRNPAISTIGAVSTSEIAGAVSNDISDKKVMEMKVTIFRLCILLRTKYYRVNLNGISGKIPEIKIS